MIGEMGSNPGEIEFVRISGEFELARFYCILQLYVNMVNEQANDCNIHLMKMRTLSLCGRYCHLKILFR